MSPWVPIRIGPGRPRDRSGGERLSLTPMTDNLQEDGEAQPSMALLHEIRTGNGIYSKARGYETQVESCRRRETRRIRSQGAQEKATTIGIGDGVYCQHLVDSGDNRGLSEDTEAFPGVKMVRDKRNPVNHIPTPYLLPKLKMKLLGSRLTGSAPSA